MKTTIDLAHRKSLEKINGIGRNIVLTAIDENHEPVFKIENKEALESLMVEMTKDIYVGFESASWFDKILIKVDRAFKNGINNILDYFHTTNVLIDDVIEYKTKTPNITDLYKLRVGFVKLRQNVEWRKIANRKAPVTMGLVLSLPEVVAIADKHMEFVANYKNVFKEFNKIVDSILDSKVGHIKIKVDEGQLNKIKKENDGANKSLATVTSSKVLVDRKPINKLVSGYDEFNTVINNVLVLGKTYNIETLEDIEKRVGSITAKLDSLHSALKNNKANMDKKDLKKLTEYLDIMANFVTSSAFLHYTYFQLLDMTIAVIKIMQTTEEDHTIVDNVAFGIRYGYKTMYNYVKSL